MAHIHIRVIVKSASGEDTDFFRGHQFLCQTEGGAPTPSAPGWSWSGTSRPASPWSSAPSAQVDQ
jgi:hypothetical protein